MYKKSRDLMAEWELFKSFMLRVWVKRRGWIYDPLDISTVIEYWGIFSDKRGDLYDLYPSNVQIYFMFKDLISVYEEQKNGMSIKYLRSIKKKFLSKEYLERCNIMGKKTIRNKKNENKYSYSKEYSQEKQRKTMRKKKEMMELLEKHKKSISAKNDFF